MQVSHSRIETFNQCGMKYKYRYIDKLKTLPNYEPDNPLIVGTCLHTGIEKNVTEALNEYRNYFPMLTDKHIEEMIKLEMIIPKCKEILPAGLYEQEILSSEFIGYMDLIVNVGNNVYDLYDFKYSNNVDRYLKSGQLHEYKYFFEKTTGKKIRKMYFMFAPKISIRMKKTENVISFRRRLYEELEKSEPKIVEVNYDFNFVKKFLTDKTSCENAKEFKCKLTRLCDWCEYKEYCTKGETFMLLPKNERKTSSKISFKKIWLYGLPFSGKTYLANKFENVLMLNTDGNTKYIDAPCVSIKDEITVDGRITNRKLAWDIFKETISELEKKQNDFETIVVDLLEDTFEHCRLWGYKEMNIEHESDNSFKAWDFIRNEFLNTIKRLMNLDYNIILISHEDSSKDVTRKSGDKITSIKPNINDKTALKVAGMVDIVGRVINDEGNRIISFKTNDVIFGGGRLQLKELEIPCEYDDLIAIYKNVGSEKKEAPVVKEETPVEKTEVVEPEETKVEEVKTEVKTETPKRTRRVRNVQ